MSEEVNKEQTKNATQEKPTELTDAQLDEAAGGNRQPRHQIRPTSGDPGDGEAFSDSTLGVGFG